MYTYDNKVYTFLTNMAKDKQFLTVIQAAKAMNMTRAAVYKKIRNGQIDVENIHGRFLIPAEGIDVHQSGALTDKGRGEIDKSVAKVVKEYGETLKLLGKE